MKPTRGLSKPWLSLVPKERRSAVVSLALLMGILGSLLFYQRFLTDGTAPGTPSLPLDGGKSPTNVAGVVVDPASNPGATSSVVAGPPVPPAPAPAPARLLPPLAGEHKALRSYGFYKSADFGDYRTFPGIAFAAVPGDTVLAAADGTVKSVDSDQEYGTVVSLEHTGGMVTRYSGLGKVQVSQGMTVKAGSPIGFAGTASTRDVPGAHLLFEVALNGEPQDPGPYLLQ